MTARNLVLLGCLAAQPAGCAQGDGREATRWLSQDLISPNRVMPNGIAMNRIGANRIGANRIGANHLAINALDAAPLLATPEGRELLGYLVSCALPEGETLAATVDDVPYEFTGLVGLAPGWEDRALSDGEKRWVSACILARVNAHGVSVSISMRGNHPALSVTTDELAAYDLEEGAFYGNIFVPVDQPIEWVACRGAAQAAGETGDLVDRDCAEPSDRPDVTQCGFVYAGDCQSLAADHPTAHACSAKRDGHYEHCHTVAGTTGWPGGRSARR